MESTKTARIACITGASSGIGRACALELDRLGFRLVLLARRRPRLERLVEQLSRPALLLEADVSNRQAVEDAFGRLPEEWKNVEVLVNNAGLASGLDPIQRGDVDDWERMIDTNIKGLLYVTRALTPRMAERKCGHIINIGSIAGKETYPNGNVYCATKHAVDALSKGMRLDLLEHNIAVSQVSPGMVETEFSVVRFHGNEEKASQVYRGMEPLHPEDVAAAVGFILSRPEHVVIQDLLIMPRAQASATQVKRNG